MAITNYDELQQAVMDKMDRPDLADFIPDFITQAENWLNYGSENASPLRCREMEEDIDLTPASGICTLPSDYLEYVFVVERQAGREPMDFITAKQAAALYPFGEGGIGEKFTIIGSKLYTYPLVSNDVRLVYYQALPPLASNTTNWLLDKAPGLYLRATLIHAYDFTRDDGETEKQAALAKTLVAGMNKSDMMGKYARAGLTLRGVTP